MKTTAFIPAHLHTRSAPRIRIYPQAHKPNVSRLSILCIALIVGAAALRISAYAQPDKTEAQRRAAIQAGVFVAGEQQRLAAYRNQKNPNPELLAKGAKETAALAARMQAKWAATPYLKLYETALQKTLDDPTFRDRAVQELDRPAERNLPSSSPPASAPVSAVKGRWFDLDSIFKIAGYVIFGAIVVFFARFFWWLMKRDSPQGGPPQPQTSDIYGTADWAEPRAGMPDQMYIFNGVFFGKASLPEYDGIATANHTGGPVCSTPGNHVLVTGRTRVGKGCRVVCPTLLRCYLDRSALIVDPKGENAAITARARMTPFPGKDYHQGVHIINPWGEISSTFQNLGLPFATYNPLDILDRNDPNVTSIAQDLATAICPKEKGGKDAFWSQSAANILTAVLLWLTYAPGETKTLGRAREIVTKPKKEFQDDYLIPMAAVSDPKWRAIRQNAGPFIGMAQETFSGIMGNLAHHTAFLSDPQIDAATATSSFSMLDLMRKPTTVYLVVPPYKMDIQRTWLRLMISAGMQTYKHHAHQNALRCMFMIDEFPALGRLDEIPRDIATMAGYGVDFVLIAQGLDQLKDVYAEASNTIINNCAYKWFCGVGDLQTAKYLSDTLGKKTVQTIGRGVNVNQGQGGGSSGSSTTYGETGRSLLMPDEVINLGRDAAVLLAPGEKPHYLRPVDYWALGEAFEHLHEICPHLYWDPPMRWDENPLPH